jgi:hypothetical protein
MRHEEPVSVSRIGSRMMGSERMGMRVCESEIEFERDRDREYFYCKERSPVHETFEPVRGRVK